MFLLDDLYSALRGKDGWKIERMGLAWDEAIYKERLGITNITTSGLKKIGMGPRKSVSGIMTDIVNLKHLDVLAEKSANGMTQETHQQIISIKKQSLVKRKKKSEIKSIADGIITEIAVREIMNAVLESLVVCIISTIIKLIRQKSKKIKTNLVCILLKIIVFL